MTDTSYRVRLWTLLVMTIVSVVVWLPAVGGADRGQPAASNLLEVHFLDVGQGDAIFIETPDGLQVLIDGGRDASVLRQLARQMSFFDRTIDVVIATHPDGDHIGGLIDVLERYDVASIVTSGNAGDTPTASAFVAASTNEGAVLHQARAGETIQLGASTTLHILFPAGDASVMESNASSIVVQLRYGDIEFMLTGDAPAAIEKYLVSTYGTALESEVLKVGHHGSKTSSDATFLDAVEAKYAVVSAGADNSYGHPHQEVVDRLVEYGMEILETAESGTITFYSDGVSVWVK